MGRLNSVNKEGKPKYYISTHETANSLAKSMNKHGFTVLKIKMLTYNSVQDPHLSSKNVEQFFFFPFLA